jgi:hypothetical protein
MQDDMQSAKPNDLPSNGNHNNHNRPVQFQKTFNWTRLSAFGKHVMHGYGRIFEKPPWGDEGQRIKAS